MARQPLWIWLLIPSILLIAAWSAQPIQAGDPPHYDRTCISNIKQLALGMIMYGSDYDDNLPDSRHWMTRTEPYLKTRAVESCPEIREPATYGYAMNSAATKITVPNPEAIPLVYDSDKLWRNAGDPVASLPHPGRHQGKNTIGYLDGHVRGVKP